MPIQFIIYISSTDLFYRKPRKLVNKQMLDKIAIWLVFYLFQTLYIKNDRINSAILVYAQYPFLCSLAT
jgi:hypothetical protein